MQIEPELNDGIDTTHVPNPAAPLPHFTVQRVDPYVRTRVRNEKPNRVRWSIAPLESHNEAGHNTRA